MPKTQPLIVSKVSFFLSIFFKLSYNCILFLCIIYIYIHSRNDCGIFVMMLMNYWNGFVSKLFNHVSSFKFCLFNHLLSFFSSKFNMFYCFFFFQNDALKYRKMVAYNMFNSELNKSTIKNSVSEKVQN